MQTCCEVKVLLQYSKANTFLYSDGEILWMVCGNTKLTPQFMGLNFPGLLSHLTVTKHMYMYMLVCCVCVYFDRMCTLTVDS